VSRTDPTTRHRRETCGDVEPIRSQDRVIVRHGTSLYANLPELAVDVLGFEAEDDLVVETYDDRVVIKPKHEQQ
jgi:hypothetical protein